MAVRLLQRRGGQGARLTVLLAAIAPLAAVAEGLPQGDEPEESQSIASREVGVDGVEYRLICSGDKFELRSWLAGREDAAHVEVVDRQVFGPGRVRSLTLARWFRRSLCAVVELEVKGAHVYHYCVFPERSKAERTRVGGTVWAAKALDSPKRLKILAFSGELGGDSLLFVLAKTGVSPEGRRTFDEGYLVVDDCPRPPVAPMVTPFKGEPTMVPAELRKFFGQ